MRKEANLEWGSLGHGTEYVLTLRAGEYDLEDVPESWEDELRIQLDPSWGIVWRGDRLEVFPPGLKQTMESDKELLAAILSLISEDYVLIAVSFLD